MIDLNHKDDVRINKLSLLISVIAFKEGRKWYLILLFEMMKFLS